MHSSRKSTIIGCLLLILMPTMVYGQNNEEEPLAIYLDVRNEIQNVISLVNKHETKFSDFDDKLLRIQNMLEKFEKQFLKLEQNINSVENMDQKLQVFNTKFEQRLSSTETNLASSMRVQEDNFKTLSDNNLALQEEFLSHKDDCCSSGNNLVTENLSEVIATAANTTQSLAVKSTIVSMPQISRDCVEVKMKLGSHYEDGVHEIQLSDSDTFDVYCLTRCSQGDQINCCPWTVILRYENSGVRPMYNSCWKYENGFGSASHDYFIGLDRLHKMTNLKRQTLLVAKIFQSGEYFIYDDFSIRDERNNYDVDILGDSWGHKIGAKLFSNAVALKYVVRNQCDLWPFKTVSHFNLFNRRFSTNYFMAIRPKICQ
ncbi:angiopoietin-2 isoform X2 [Bactrocera oleae]|uniref:angiopoietin-2 isoform X2 n=1 Tax=Bactrocera oleae TaxID=104688 RepID=UPI00387E3C14